MTDEIEEHEEHEDDDAIAERIAQVASRITAAIDKDDEGMDIAVALGFVFANLLRGAPENMRGHALHAFFQALSENSSDMQISIEKHMIQ